MQPDFQNSKTSANDTAGNFYFSGNYFWIIAHFRKTFWNVRCRHFILQQVVVKWDWVWKVWLNCLFTNYERKCLLEEDFNFSGISPDPPSSNSRIPGWMWQTGKLSEWGKLKSFFSSTESVVKLLRSMGLEKERHTSRTDMPSQVIKRDPPASLISHSILWR